MHQGEDLQKENQGKQADHEDGPAVDIHGSRGRYAEENQKKSIGRDNVSPEKKPAPLRKVSRKCHPVKGKEGGKTITIQVEKQRIQKYRGI